VAGEKTVTVTSRRKFLGAGAVPMLAAIAGDALANPYFLAPPPCPIFDVHAHLLAAPPKQAGGGYDIEADFAYRLAVMRKWSIRATALMAPYLYEQTHGLADTRRQNDYVAWYRDTHRALFPVGIGTVEPNQGAEEGIAEIRRMRHELRLDGVVFHTHYQGTGIGGLAPFARECGELGMPVFVHTVIPDTLELPSGVESLALAAPNTRIVVLGAFSVERIRSELLTIGQRFPNLMFESSYLNQMGETIASYSRTLGSQRVLYGSDMDSDDSTMYLYPAGLIDVLESDQLSEEDRKNILWANAARMFPVLSSLEQTT
jgi:predicted TIM-barrel fold metal-dependent hydrolase